jgi:rod shape-determining protein MreC
MPIGTLDRMPPPMFKQGPSALSQAMFFMALCIFLMVADARFRLVEPIRAVIATVVIPVQRSLATPVQAWHAANDYVVGVTVARAREARANERLTQQSDRALSADRLAAENDRLRALLDLRPRLTGVAQPAEILYEAPDPFSRKVIIDRGLTHGVVRGAPLINEAGVLGQVTRAYPLTSEVTLLTDRDAAIPVLNGRTQQRGAAFGDPLSVASGGGMELRFMANNADVQAGDLLTTSGVDGVYPPGLPVAKVLQVDRRADPSFAKVMLSPVAVNDGIRLAMVLEPTENRLPPRPRPEVAPTPAAVKAAAKAASAASAASTASAASGGDGPASVPVSAAAPAASAVPAPALPPSASVPGGPSPAAAAVRAASR